MKAHFQEQNQLQNELFPIRILLKIYIFRWLACLAWLERLAWLAGSQIIRTPFEHWNKTNKYLPIINQLLILSNMILTWWDLQVGGKITGNKCVHYGFQEFEIASPYWTRTKQTYSLLTAGQKISLDEKSLEIIFWTLYLCALSSIIWKLAMRRTHANLLTVLCKQWY